MLSKTLWPHFCLWVTLSLTAESYNCSDVIHLKVQKGPFSSRISQKTRNRSVAMVELPRSVHFVVSFKLMKLLCHVLSLIRNGFLGRLLLIRVGCNGPEERDDSGEGCGYACGAISCRHYQGCSTLRGPSVLTRIAPPHPTEVRSIGPCMVNRTAEGVTSYGGHFGL